MNDGHENYEAALEEQNRVLGLMQLITSKGVSELGSGTALQTIALEVAARLDYKICNIFMPTEDGIHLEIVAGHGGMASQSERRARSEANRFDDPLFMKTPPAIAFESGRQSSLEDATAFDEFPHLAKIAKTHGFRSMLASPLHYNDECLGALVVYTEDIHDFSERERQLLSSISEQVSGIAGSARLYDQLRASEKRFRDTVAGAVDWMYTVDNDRRVIDCNDAMVSDLGYERDEIIGRRITDLIAKEQRDRQATDTELQAAMENRYHSTERTFISRDGRHLIQQINTVAVFNTDGEVVKWHSVARDMTEKKMAEKEIMLLLTAVESSREGIVVIDMDGAVISINSAGARMLGRSTEQMTGCPISDFWSDDNAESLAGNIREATLDGGWEGQIIYRRSDGTNLPVHVSSSPVKDGDGAVQAMVGIFRDVSEEQRMTEEILRRNRELAVINAISTTSTKSVDLDAMLGDCVETLVKTMNYDAGTIYLNGGQTGVVSCIAQCCVPNGVREHIDRYAIEQAERARSAELPLYIEDAFKQISSSGADETIPWFTSAAVIPIVSKEKRLGLLTVFTFERHSFDELEQSLLLSVGKNLGVIVERARLFDDVARGKAEWESTFDALTDGLSIHDREFNILRANKSLSEMLGIANDDLIGRKCYEVFHGRSEPIPGCPQIKASETGSNAMLLHVEPHLGATVAISADPILDAGGKVVGTAHDVRDVTEEEHLREQLSQSERLRALGVMASGVAHDFNNYLTIILGNSQLLLSQEDGGLSGDDRESLRIIEQAAVDAGETVRRIQEFTLVRAARMFTTVDLNQVIHNAIEVARPRWRDQAMARNAEIEVKTSLGKVQPVNGNASELGEVVMNLILNAADALIDGGTITIESSQSGDTVEVRVDDDGDGMDTDTAGRIFDPFFTTKGPAGVGLGLSVAYGIINRHGGRISVDSEMGKGTRFEIRLPVATVEDMDGNGPEQPALEAKRAAKVLVIDDMEMVRTLLNDLLVNLGHEAVCASSGSAGVELFMESLKSADREFDLVLSDLGMPGMSGWEVADAVKAASPETPVMLITGWGDQLDEERMERSSIDGILAKPFTMEQIGSHIADILGEEAE